MVTSYIMMAITQRLIAHFAGLMCLIIYLSNNRTTSSKESSSIRRNLLQKLDPKTVVYKNQPPPHSTQTAAQSQPEEGEIDLAAEKAKNKWKKIPVPLNVTSRGLDVTPVEQKKDAIKEEKIGISQSTADGATTIDNFPYQLPASAQEWCSPSILPSMDYDKCADRSVVNSIPLYGGLTNSLKIVLLGAILSFEENRCFYVDESLSELLRRTDQTQSLDSFLNRYLEPIGLRPSSPIFKSLTPETTQERNWKEVWDWRHNRRVQGQLDTIPGLGYPEMEGHTLKRIVMRRLFRLQPHIRDLTCRGLERHGLQEEFMTFSVRQGDKMKEEHFSYATMSQYIEAAEEAIPKYFDDKVPPIFVATDDCMVMKEFRTLRPTWRWFSECDNIQNRDHGFALVDMKDWTKEQTDAHFHKFFVELYAMAISKYFVGVIYTNVTWWAFFMRQDAKDRFKIIQTPGTETREPVELW